MHLETNVIFLELKETFSNNMNKGFFVFRRPISAEIGLRGRYWKYLSSIPTVCVHCWAIYSGVIMKANFLELVPFILELRINWVRKWKCRGDQSQLRSLNSTLAFSFVSEGKFVRGIGPGLIIPTKICRNYFSMEQVVKIWCSNMYVSGVLSGSV